MASSDSVDTTALSDDQLLEHYAKIQQDPDKLEKVVAAANEAVTLEKQIKDVKERVSRAEGRLTELRMKIIPDLLDSVGTDRLGLEEHNLDLKVENYFHANISSDWEPARREAAFKWLEDNNFGDLIKITISVAFGRNEYQKAMDLKEIIEAHGHQVSLEKGVPWNTLTAWLREQWAQSLRAIEKGEEPLVRFTDRVLETLGATIGRVTKWKLRK